PALGEARKQPIDLLHPLMDERNRGFLIGAEAQILLDGELREDLTPFRDARDAGRDDLVGRQSGDIGAIEDDAAGTRRREPEDGADQARLAGPVRAEKTGYAAGLDGEGHVLQNVGAVIGRV